ncbi:MAG: TerD family protein [Planctomycetaceae bacterium]|jgi:tellurium resistance protein TerD|nr:TerD family protein [Planctomycetaceae bacterium]
MAISLVKGGNMSLSQASPGLNKIKVGLGWDVRVTEGAAFDLDASAFLLTESDKVRSSDDFIFYNQLKSKCGSVEHTGDNRTGAGEGDDEVINVTLNSVPADVQKIAFVVTIHEAEKNKQNFGQVSSAFIRIVEDDKDEELARFDLSEDASTSTSMIFGELYRRAGEWKFRAVGQGVSGGLAVIAQNYGVQL